MTQPKKKVLGRGLEALLPAMSESSQGQISMIRVDRIEPNPHQPRQEWDEDELRSLSDSIREQGILQPLVLRRQNLRYQVIAGERRLRAARMAGLEEVPAVLREATDAQMLAWALVENIQRRDLGPLEKAEAFGRLSSLFNLTQEEMGRQTGLDRSTVSNLMRLLELPEGARAMLSDGRLSMGHGRALLALRDAKAIEAAAELAVSNDMSVRQLEEYVRRASRPRVRKNTAAQTAEVHDLQERLTRRFSTRVRIRDRGGRGSIVVEYSSLNDLQRILEMMGG
ncbi:MAG TPA: ParB/RepB/Spo0J family partition protein [Candidatus Fermentibacter daniensis]|jgi:ParB family chromosome partitioning protein|nr:MAG: hypothetical protein AO395_02750 [Candidatus Fermentibacter daniensis]MBP7720017.1 ParB/RepB/Spo0J family partition protein [Candidatus Fermentibacter sp.]OQC68529.1 MAG: putative chromosome-partitioning protein ParB [candidate division Hyd24-12 bacterium ADurb.Bin004]KZD19952.1 MAG: hypothetical protein AO396_08010 [Candidatus Fermentibacter daniensis]KZD20170.1 MAG: hypothetical protein AO394_01490 [Candidatus Fermentibacter daniensis]